MTLECFSEARRMCAAAAALVGLCLAGGCDKRAAAVQQGPPPEVATFETREESITLTRELPGRTSACLVAEIRPQASGIILKRLFQEGADVGAGDVLYEIDPSSYKAAHANAKAAVAAAKAGRATALAVREVAKAALAAAGAALSRAEANAVPLRLRAERFGELVASKAVSRQDLDDVAAALKQSEAGIESAKAAVQSAEAELLRAEAAIQAAQAGLETAEAGLESARINLDYTRIAAPIAGRIGRSSVTTGALVAAHQPMALATIQKLDPIFVDVPQSTADLLSLQRRRADGRLAWDERQGAAVKLILEDGTPYPLEGKLEFREVSVDPSTGSSILRMLFPNPDGLLLPGMFVRAVVLEGVDDRAILVPQQAVSRDPNGAPFVLIVGSENKVERRPVVVDRAVGDRWLVASGLEPGERVVVEGAQRVLRLPPGAAVRAVPFEEGRQGAPRSDRGGAAAPAK